MSSAPRPGTAISRPADTSSQTPGSRLPSGPIGGQPGPLMCPGCSTVVTNPPDRVSSASSLAIAAFWVPYAPIGGDGSSSRIGCLTLRPYCQIEPQCSRWPVRPRSASTRSRVASGVKLIMSITTSGASPATRGPKVPAASSASRSTTICSTCDQVSSGT